MNPERLVTIVLFVAAFYQWQKQAAQQGHDGWWIVSEMRHGVWRGLRVGLTAAATVLVVAFAAQWLVYKLGF
jgi:hypothetical protein